MDRDLIELALREAQRLSAKSVGPNSFKLEPTIETLREVLVRKPDPRSSSHQSDSKMAGLALDSAIHLRWTLRDIKANRTKLSPVSPDDLRTLIELGLIEMQDEVPVLTSEGHRAID